MGGDTIGGGGGVGVGEPGTGIIYTLPRDLESISLGAEELESSGTFGALEPE